MTIAYAAVVAISAALTGAFWLAEPTTEPVPAPVLMPAGRHRLAIAAPVSQPAAYRNAVETAAALACGLVVLTLFGLGALIGAVTSVWHGMAAHA